MPDECFSGILLEQAAVGCEEVPISDGLEDERQGLKREEMFTRRVCGEINFKAPR